MTGYIPDQFLLLVQNCFLDFSPEIDIIEEFGLPGVFDIPFVTGGECFS